MPEQAPVALVGRDAELTRLRGVLARSAAGESSAVIVTGEPGVGKTALVRAAYVSPDHPGHRLVMTCLPLQALATGLAPLRTALRASSGPTAATTACLARIDAGDPIRAVDDWVDEVTAAGPLVVVVDDIQWADTSLRDLVLYLLAGPRNRRLAILITARTTGVPDGDPFHRWLADALHLPSVNRLEIETLDRGGTEALLADLLGGRPHQSLVEEVYRAGRGNPYLTSMLARHLDSADRHLSAELPDNLVTAVRATWHGCTAPTRALCALLAVGGGPEAVETLSAVIDDLALDIELGSSIAEAEAAGLVESRAGGRFWFRHPLQAEVLERSMPESERRRWLVAYAVRGDEAARTSEPTMEAAIVQSRRHDQAGSAAAAYGWALRAWELGQNRRGTTDLRRVLRRAVSLRPEVPDVVETAEDLWRRIRHLAAADGAYADELEAVEALLQIIDETQRPLDASELLVRRMLLRLTAGIEFLSIDDMRQAVRLAGNDRSSWQYALALAELAHAGNWSDDRADLGAADEALSLARATGEPRALTFALSSAAMLEAVRHRFDAARRLAAEAVDAAARAHDWLAYAHAVIWESNNLPEPYGQEAVAYFRRRRQELSALGGPDLFLVQLGVHEADLQLELGNSQVCSWLLREVLVCDPGPMADLRFRITGARLAAFQGRVEEALGHLQRIDDLVDSEKRFSGLSIDVARATVLLAAGRPAEAHAVALAAAVNPGVPVHMAEYLVPLTARALADQIEQVRDRRQPDSDLMTALEALHARFPRVIDPEDSDSPLWHHRLVALQAWYDAETARARREPDEPVRWSTMRTACATGRLPWLELYACWRGAEALLRRGRTGRAEGVGLLRDGHDLAVRLGADGTRAELEELARLAHVDLRTGEAVAVPDAPEFGKLTPRERELLGYLTRGLTYAEIAAALVISEKTVSSHVSNLLRKTGTSSRVELTRLVARISA